ncbi:Cation transport regulator-like protein 2 [Nowakowskiella sp. JEL0078]|nr:Cation transport regulator-like protein 2 [Nowakowskiella sp. JEL0078]
MIVFGYGSLVWKIDFPYTYFVPVYCKGFARRFWQDSTDHRGTVESPGRVVSLFSYEDWLPYSNSDPFTLTKDSICWGIAIKIPDSELEKVKAHLDFREKNGYTTYTVDLFNPAISEKLHNNSDNLPIFKNATVYVANSDNPSFVGPKPTNEIVDTIAKARGPSGKNIDYLLGLCNALRVISPDCLDDHLIALESKIKEVLNGQETEQLNNFGSVKKEFLDELKNVVETPSDDLAKLILGNF